MALGRRVAPEEDIVNRTLHNVKLKQAKDSAGEVLRGLWVSDIALLEAVHGGWECQVPMRRIGKANYFEFRPVALGGKFRIIGTYRTKDACCILAERLQAGTHVLRGPYVDSLGTAPVVVVPWADVSDEIAATA
jgi:hypothetical protein